jgi:hypothetical protein
MSRVCAKAMTTRKMFFKPTPLNRWEQRYIHQSMEIVYSLLDNADALHLCAILNNCFE